MVHLAHTYMTTGKTIALTIWAFVSKVISLLFNMLSRLVITFLPRTKCLLISRLQSLSAVILEPKKIKAMTVSIITSWQIDGKQWKQWQSAEELMCFFKYKFINSSVIITCYIYNGLPLWLSWSRIHLQCGRPGFESWIGKIPWRREQLHTPLFWPGEFHL